MNLSFLKNILRLNKKEIPKNHSIIKSEDLLRTTVIAAISEMLKDSCPCHYPRFRELSMFLHDNYKTGPVLCADTNILISCSSIKELNYLIETENQSNSGLGDYDDTIYCCSKCSTTFRQVTRQYSINFEFSYFIIEDRKFGNDIGEKVTRPFPLMKGLFGFKESDIQKCKNDFTLTDSTEFYKYLTKKTGLKNPSST